MNNTLIHATAPWETGVEYTDEFMPKPPRMNGKGHSYNPTAYKPAMEYLRQHPGCSVYELAVGAGYGQYRDQDDRIYPVEER